MATKSVMSGSLQSTMPIVTGRRPSRARVDTGIIVAVAVSVNTGPAGYDKQSPQL